jgi:hypothetical protein
MNKDNQPTILTINLVNASFLLLFVNILLNLINANNNTIAFNLNLAFKEGFGYLTRQTYQPFLTTILPYWYLFGLPDWS